MPRILPLIALCVMWTANPTRAAAQIGVPGNLTCEKETNPQSVKVPNPQLSWTMNPGIVTVAYQVLVATSEEKLRADAGDLWDSGRVISDQRTTQYRGKPLVSRQRCYWKVRVWGSYFTATRYSEPANWQMALLRFDEPLSGAPQVKFYLVDIGHGNVVFVIAPSGETMLLDCGPTQMADRIYDFMQQNGIQKIDYLVVSHFEADHMGAVAALAKKIPILNYVDHGESVTYNKSDEWWKGRRGPWWRPGIGAEDNRRMDAYKAARATGRHISVKPGDRVPIQGLDVEVVAAAGKNIMQPLAGDGANPACSQVELRAEDDAEDGQSVGIVISLGKFRFVYLGDMTWNNSYRLFCPKNKVGQVDAYLVTHHAQSMNTDLGEYYGGLSCCSVAEVQGLNPRVGLLSMGSQGHKYGTPDAIKTVRSHGMDLWQTEKIIAGGEAGWNAPDDFIANVGEPRSERVPNIKLVANPDGSFTVSNSRNGFVKNYPPRK